MKNVLFTHGIVRAFAVIAVLFGSFAIADAAENGADIWQTFILNGDTGGALESFKKAVETDPTDALAHAGLGILGPSRGGDEDALESFLNALQHGRSDPEAALYLFKAMDLVSSPADYETALKRLESVLESGEIAGHFKPLLQFSRARLLQRLGRWDEGGEGFRGLGFITKFWYCGPFDNAEKGGHNQIFGPEENLDLNATYPGRLRTVGWRPIPVAPYDGYINLHSFIAPSQESTAYLATSIDSANAQKCKIDIGHAGALKVWLNGTQIVGVDRYHDVQPDQVVLDSRLKAGTNTLLLKVSSTETGKYGVYVRVVPENPESLSIDSPMTVSELPDLTAHTPVSDVEAPLGVNHEPVSLRQLQAKGKASGTKPYRHLFYALLLQRWQVTDEHDQSVATLLTQLNTICPKNPVVLRTLGGAEKQENRQRLAFTQALDVDPDDRASFLELLKYYRKSPYATKGYDLIREWGKERDIPVSARLEQARMLTHSGLQEAAIDLLRSVEGDLGAEGKRLLYRWNSSRMTDDDKKTALETILKDDARNANTIHDLRKLALRRGDETALAELLVAEHRINPFSITGLIDIALYRQGRNEFERSLTVLKQALAVSPDDFEAHRLSAIAHHQLERDEEAIQELKLALTVRPSDPWALDYMEYLKPDEETYASPYLKEWKEIDIPETLDLSKANFVTLLDQRIVRVHQNGNASETVRQAIKILTDTGIRYQQVRGIYYEGDSEIIRINRARVWKPDGTFYDAPAAQHRSASSAADASQLVYQDYRVAVLQFQALEKGSVLELEYEKEDRGENVYADYFGDQYFIGSDYYEPTVVSEYVLIAPESREFYWKYIPPHYPASVKSEHVVLKAEPELTVSGSEKTYHWTFGHLPTIPREPLMPYSSEVLPYLKISTFQTWQEMTEWYWNLVRDQIIPGPVVKNQLKQVIAEYREKNGFSEDQELSDWDKVRAVNAFVNTGVRYLGLEFGIQGYRPRKVNEICNTKYGDCKDKAVLAMVMLGELGIKAHQIIIRTTSRGEIDYELPMLGIFNHSIYYIPDLDGKEYWVDGTATFFDAKELPSGDAGANTLIVLPDGDSFFKRVPHSKPEENGGVYTTLLKLDTDGNAKGYRAADFRGLYNPMVRRTYENKAKAKEVVDRSLVGTYPGAQSSNIELSDLDNYATSERIYYELEVPQFGAKQGNRLAIPTTFFAMPFSKSFAHLSKREFDLVLNYPWARTNRFTLELPQEPETIVIPEDRELKGEFGSYIRKIERQGNKIEIREDFIFRPVRVHKEKYQDFREFCRLADLYQDEKISVVF